jgi:hypothetical protein
MAPTASRGDSCSYIFSFLKVQNVRGLSRFDSCFDPARYFVAIIPEVQASIHLCFLLEKVQGSLSNLDLQKLGVDVLLGIVGEEFILLIFFLAVLDSDHLREQLFGGLV